MVFVFHLRYRGLYEARSVCRPTTGYLNGSPRCSVLVVDLQVEASASTLFEALPALPTPVLLAHLDLCLYFVGRPCSNRLQSVMASTYLLKSTVPLSCNSLRILSSLKKSKSDIIVSLLILVLPRLYYSLDCIDCKSLLILGLCGLNWRIRFLGYCWSIEPGDPGSLQFKSAFISVSSLQRGFVD